MADIITLKKGLDIPLTGGVDSYNVESRSSDMYAIVPDDFPGHTWKVRVKPGDQVKKSSPLLTDKATDKIAITSPVDGIVEEIRRGERRKIEAIVINPSSNSVNDETTFTIGDTKDDIIDVICKSGLWVYLRQRPYDIVPNPQIAPRDIFVTAFDSAPLAPEIITQKTLNQDYLDAGIKALAKLTEGKVYLCVPFGSGISSASAKVVEIQGPHPAGNVGVQIANIKPINKGETVWATDAKTVIRIGELMLTGKTNFSTIVALTGPDVKHPKLIATTIGASIKSLVKDELKQENGNIRIISGNVLTGIKSAVETDFLRFPYRQITAIDEGDSADEFMGWASLSPNKYSVKRSFPSTFKFLTKKFDFDARIRGGHRAMILSGEYDKVLPMDIYSEYLIKAILANDIDRMEKLGIYEVAPEDFALPEFVDTSKLPLQQIVADGLSRLRKELE
jgi:Na+-transporting NADH:ubiquinone oxidoreductase subunit A